MVLLLVFFFFFFFSSSSESLLLVLFHQLVRIELVKFELLLSEEFQLYKLFMFMLSSNKRLFISVKLILLMSFLLFFICTTLFLLGSYLYNVDFFILYYTIVSLYEFFFEPNNPKIFGANLDRWLNFAKLPPLSLGLVDQISDYSLDFLMMILQCPIQYIWLDPGTMLRSTSVGQIH
jgi:hypothetical protein